MNIMHQFSIMKAKHDFSMVSALPKQRFQQQQQQQKNNNPNIFWNQVKKSFKHLVQTQVIHTIKWGTQFNYEEHQLCRKQKEKKKFLPGPLEVTRTNLAEADLFSGLTVEFEAPLLVEAAGLHAVAKAVTGKRSRWDTRQELIWPIM